MNKIHYIYSIYFLINPFEDLKLEIPHKYINMNKKSYLDILLISPLCGKIEHVCNNVCKKEYNYI